jgi:hypothetical protein
MLRQQVAKVTLYGNFDTIEVYDRTYGQSTGGRVRFSVKKRIRIVNPVARAHTMSSDVPRNRKLTRRPLS